MDLDADCDSLGTELKDTFRRLKLFIDVYFQITGQGDFTNEEFDIVFNMDLPVNETDIINNAVNSNGLLSKRTILQNHPWVTDVDEELPESTKKRKPLWKNTATAFSITLWAPTTARKAATAPA